MKLINFGSCNIDYVYAVDHIVNRGETESACGMQVFAGGKGLNQSIAAARAGAEIYHAGCIGEGGEFLEQILKESGVDTSYLKRVDEKNGHAIIQVSRAGENSIVIYPGSNAALTPKMIDEVLCDFCAGDVLMLQNEVSNVEYIIDRAYGKGMKIVLNPSPISEELLRLDLKKITYLVLNEVEARAITGAESEREALDFLAKRYPALRVVLTVGARGCIYRDEAGEIFQPSFKVKVKDTTAAGDTFTGYFVAEIMRGADASRALRAAACAAGIAVSRSGAAPSIPTANEVAKNEIRANMKERRAALTADEREEKSRAAALALLGTDEYKRARSIMLYRPIGSEMDTSYIAKAAHADGKCVLYPVTDEESRKITPVKAEADAEFVRGGFKIPEPVGEVYDDKIDLIVVPGLAFGRDGMRLGYGKGCYDEFLNRAAATRAGLCYELQLTDTLPCEAHDEKMNMVVTENEIIKNA